jgi:hypothetical protein
MFDKYKTALSDIDDFDRLSSWLDSIGLEKQFLEYAAKTDGIQPSDGEWEKTRLYMLPQLKALTGRFSKLEEEAFYRFYLPIDDVIQKALASPSYVE